MRNWFSAFALALCASALLSAQAAAPAKPAPPTPQTPTERQQTGDLPVRSVGLPAAREIVDKYVQAIGGRQAILAHSSSHATGNFTVASAGITGTIDIYNAKPAKSLVKTTVGGIGEILEGSDGTHGMGISPMTGPSLAQ